jgi:4-hydroxy-tetrahydrodipicolinate reductase
VQVKQQHPNLIMVDYTVPDVIHDMVDLYIKHKTPFVMGTTGGNRAQILAEVAAADLYAVIAPQMGKQVSSIDGATGKWLIPALPHGHSEA